MHYINRDKGKHIINGCALRHFYKKNFLTNIGCSLGHFFFKKNSSKYKKKNYSLAVLWGTFIKNFSREYKKRFLVNLNQYATNSVIL